MPLCRHCEERELRSNPVPPPFSLPRMRGWEKGGGLLRFARNDEEDYAALIGGTGSAVTDLIFSIAKRDVTFLSATALISFL